jgi:hypothetical protein
MTTIINSLGGVDLGSYCLCVTPETDVTSKRQKLLESARKIKESAKIENSYLNGSLDDEL